MRLTNTIRNAFIRSAMQDVPLVDYNEQAQNLLNSVAQTLFIKTFPDADYKKLKEAGWLNESWFDTPRGLRNCYIYAPSDCSQLKTTELNQKLTDLGIASIEQDKQRNDLEAKLRSVAYSVTTRQALVKALPEFEKYLPDAPDAVANNLPAVANLVADFTKAGWPKNQLQAATPPKKTYGNSVKTLPAIT